MELIPILSMIILVSTVATFILAIGSYGMYKIREKRGMQKKNVAPQAFEAEVITPKQTTVTQPKESSQVSSQKEEQKQPNRAFQPFATSKSLESEQQDESQKTQQQAKGDTLRWR